MIITKTELKGVYIIEQPKFRDERGYFMESYNKSNFIKHKDLNVEYVQDNVSISKENVIRGLHFQTGEHAQAKLVNVIRGSVLDVIVDLRPESKTFGKHIRIYLTGWNQKQVFIPRGFAHGFITLEDNTIFSYKCDNYYNKKSESGILYNDPDLAIEWHDPNKEVIVSEKDLKLPKFKELELWKTN